MIIGIPKETKSDERRVGIVTAGVRSLALDGHEVYIERNAGVGAGFSDEAYESAGAHLAADASEIYGRADLIVKVKEPLPGEIELIRERQVLFTYFHFAASESLTRGFIDTGATAIAYETVQSPDGALPLLIPMSEIAGRMATQQGAKYLESPQGGRGVLLGGVPGVAPADRRNTRRRHRGRECGSRRRGYGCDGLHARYRYRPDA
jgi:alanine dehydrogenase